GEARLVFAAPGHHRFAKSREGPTHRRLLDLGKAARQLGFFLARESARQGLQLGRLSIGGLHDLERLDLRARGEAYTLENVPLGVLNHRRSGRRGADDQRAAAAAGFDFHRLSQLGEFWPDNLRPARREGAGGGPSKLKKRGERLSQGDVDAGRQTGRWNGL